MQGYEYNDTEHFASQNGGSQVAPTNAILNHRSLSHSQFADQVPEANTVNLALGLGTYNVYISLDTSCLPSSEAILKHITRRLRSLRRWRCEGLFLFTWLLHICLVWTLRALEASEADSACVKKTG